MSKNEGPHGPQGPWAQNHKIIRIIKIIKIIKIKSLKIRKIIVFFDIWKSSAPKFCGGSTERELQIIDMVILGAKIVFGNLWKSDKSIKIGSILGTSLMVLKTLEICQNFGKFWVRAVCPTTRLRKAIG